MSKDKTTSKPNTKWSPEEERALLRAMDKVNKNPPPGGQKGKQCPVYWNEVSVVMRLDSNYKFNRTGKACDVRSQAMKRKQDASNSKEEVAGSPGLSRHWTKVVGEIGQIRSDISQTCEKVTGVEHSVVRLEEEVSRMRESIQNIERMIMEVCE